MSDLHDFWPQAGSNICVCGYPRRDVAHSSPRWACVGCGWEWPSRMGPPPINAECDHCGDELGIVA